MGVRGGGAGFGVRVRGFQDPPGKQAVRFAKSYTTEDWLNDLHDGTHAVSLFNRDTTDADLTLPEMPPDSWVN